MKVTRASDGFRLHESSASDRKVDEKPDKEGFSQQRQQDDTPQDRREETPSREDLELAIQQFATDRQSRENGLQADLVGQGPGLKVVLKDGTGAVIRQFTGEEFVKLREAVASDTPRGKILDQKL